MNLLDSVEREDEVCIRHTDGRLFVLKPLGKSPLDNAGNIRLDTADLTLRDGGTITGQAQYAAGGNIGMRIADRIDLANGEISTSVGSGGAAILCCGAWISLCSIKAPLKPAPKPRRAPAVLA